MKKQITFLLMCCCTLAVTAQDLISKVPATAHVVATIKGKNVTKLVSIKEFENSKIGEMFTKELRRETDGKIANLEDLGFDFNQNFYYFLETEDGVLSNVFLAPLNGRAGFENLLSERERKKITQKNGVSYFVDNYDNIITMWNDKTLLFMVSVDTKENDYGYYDDYGFDAPAASAEEAVEETLIESTEVEEVEETVIYESTEEVEETVIESVEEDVIEETVIESTEDYYDSDSYKEQQRQREERWQKREEERKKKREKLNEASITKAMAIFKGNLAQGNITRNGKYMASVGSGQDEAHVWVNDVDKIYKSALPSYVLGANPMDFYNLERLYGGMTLSARLNFEEDKIRLKTDYGMNAQMGSLYGPMYNGTMNKNFYKYINEDQMLGYFAVNLSTEGLLKAYPKLMDYMFENSPNDEIATIAPLATELFAIVVDEKGVSELLRGDMLFVLTDIKEREVTYTSYDYDEEYNRTETTKTKMEQVPDFLFMATASKKELYKRLMRLAVKENEATFENGIYQFKTPRSVPFDMFLTFKDDVVLFGSSKSHLMAINKGAFNAKVSGTHKKIMSKNSSSIYVNGKRIVNQIPAELYPRELRDKVDYLVKNTEDVLFTTSKVKGNKMQGEMIWNTAEEGHKNSLAYFLNIINTLAD